MKKDFFSLLNKKLQAKAPNNMDEAFWNSFEDNFEDNFGENKSSNMSWLNLPQLTGVLSLIVVGALFVFISNQNFDPQSHEVAEILQQEEFLDNMDMLEFMANNELTHEDMEILLEDMESTEHNEG